MNNFKRFTIGLSTVVCMGAACAQSPMPTDARFEERLMTPQFRVSARNRQNNMLAQRQTPQRRFIMPANSTGMYSRGAQPYRTGADNMGSSNSRMTPDERRALRRQINEANQGIYMRRRRTSSPGF